MKVSTFVTLLREIQFQFCKTGISEFFRGAPFILVLWETALSLHTDRVDGPGRWGYSATVQQLPPPFGVVVGFPLGGDSGPPAEIGGVYSPAVRQRHGVLPHTFTLRKTGALRPIFWSRQLSNCVAHKMFHMLILKQLQGRLLCWCFTQRSWSSTGPSWDLKRKSSPCAFSMGGVCGSMFIFTTAPKHDNAQQTATLNIL